MTPALASSADDISILVREVSATQTELDRLELLLGALREEVNRKLVDLDDAQGDAEQARQEAADADQELNRSQSELEQAQARLDEIARATYRYGGASPTGMAGADATQDMLDRRSYLRQRGDQQQRVVDDLEQARTQSANSESRARAAAQLADARAAEALAAEEEAQASLAENTAELEEALAQRDELLRQRDSAQAELVVQRGTAPDGGEPAPIPAAADAVEAGETADTTEPEETESLVEVEAAEQGPAVEAEAMVAASQPDHGSLADPYATPVTVDGGEATDADSEPADSAIAARQAPMAPMAAVPDTPSTEATAEEADSEPVASSTAGQTGGSSAGLLTGVVSLLGTSPAAEPATESDIAGVGPVAGESGSSSGTGAASLEEAAGELETALPESSTAESVTDAASDLIDAGVDARIENVIARAESRLGTPYAWGGGSASGPTPGIRDGGTADAHGDYGKVGFDCSGFTLYAFAGAGISLPHYTGYQYQRGTKVDPQEMQRGDLIFYGPNGDQHVAIYLGDGMMIEAPSSGGVVQKTPVRWSGMSPHAVRLI